MKFRKLNYFISLVFLFIGLVAMASLPPLRSGQPVKKQAPYSVRTINPSPAPAGDATRLPVVIEASEEAFLYARVSGFVAERRVEIGDLVQEGEVLAVIDVPELIHQKDRLKAELATVKAQLELNKIEQKRGERLALENNISDSEMDARIAKTKIAEAQSQSIQAELSKTEELLRFRMIRAPFSGRIVASNIDRGDLVTADQAGPGHYLFHLVSADDLRMVVHVPQSELANVKVGLQVVAAFPGYDSGVIEGRVSQMAGKVDRRSGTMRVEATLINQNNTIPIGLSGEVEFRKDTSGHKIWQLPLGAFVYRSGQPHVALIREGEVHFVKVETGRNLGQFLEVLSGLNANSDVILNPNAMLRSGDTVVAKRV